MDAGVQREERWPVGVATLEPDRNYPLATSGSADARRPHKTTGDRDMESVTSTVMRGRERESARVRPCRDLGSERLVGSHVKPVSTVCHQTEMVGGACLQTCDWCVHWPNAESEQSPWCGLQTVVAGQSVLEIPGAVGAFRIDCAVQLY